LIEFFWVGAENCVRQDEEVKLTADTLTFSGTSGGKLYGLDVKLFKAVNPEESTTKVLPRSIQMFIKKVSLILSTRQSS
jgi:hypothetical protein